ncbi:hypothetical protein, partial [Pantoea ananatis]|uniref:hypothetical protein n=1 Tax=Pantoea ananas TaxID=553 RepID=UPI0023B03F4B
ALRANAFKTNAAGKAAPNKKHAPTDACFQEASAARQSRYRAQGFRSLEGERIQDKCRRQSRTK